jgi:hypothetical protein
MNDIDRRRKEDFQLEKPNSDGNVWQRQVCPAFTPRDNTTLKECFYCKYADFHLDKPKPLEVGVCYFPKSF